MLVAAATVVDAVANVVNIAVVVSGSVVYTWS